MGKLVGFGGRSFSFVVAMILLAVFDLQAACVVKTMETETGLPAFEDDDYFDMQVRKSGDGSNTRITGDTVIIDEKRMASIVSTPAYAKTKFVNLTFDARVLKIRGPLSLEGGNLTLLAERIIFEKGGRVTLLAGADHKSRALRIVTESLEFSGGPKRPIHINGTSGGSFKAMVVVPSVQASQSKAEFWKRFVDSLEFDSVPPEVVIKTGKEAESEFETAYQNETEWPLFFAAKLRKHFSQTPYSEKVREDITKLANTYDQRLRKWREPLPLVLVGNVRAAIRNKTDLDGHLFSYAPKQDLTDQGKSIDNLIKLASFDDLIELVATTGGDSNKLKAIVDANRKEMEKTTQETKSVEKAIEESNGQLAKLSQQLDGNTESLRQRSELIKRWNEDDVKRNKDAIAVKQWSTVAASAVVIAASMGAATPAVAAGAAAGLAVTGEVIYGHNANKPLTALDVVAKGVTVYEASMEYQKSWKATSEAKNRMVRVYNDEEVKSGPEPEEGQKDTRERLTRGAATAEYLLSIADAADKAKKIIDEGVATPSDLSLSKREEEDGVMRQLLATQADLMNAIAMLETQIKADTAQLELLAARSLELAETDVNLRAAKPENDQQASRWNAIALSLWSRSIKRIGGMLNAYSRSLYFETGRTPKGIQGALNYPNELVSEIAAGILDPLGGVGTVAPPDEIRTRMKVSKAKFLSSVNETIAAIDETYDGYLKDRTEADVQRRSYRFKADSLSEIDRGFIEALNGQIVQQMVGKSKAADLLPALIPYELPVGVNDYPERLIHATTVDVVLNSKKENIGPGSLDFVVIHPSYGEMRRDGACFQVDFRANPTDWRKFTTPFEQITPKWSTRERSKVSISKNQSARYYTYYPARTAYHMVVNVLSKNWKSIPKIQEIEIGLEVMQ